MSNLLTVSESLELLADRCLFPGFKGTVAPDWIRRRVAGGLGGVLFFGRNVESLEQATGLAASLHAERPELLIAIDEEGGDVTRLGVATGSSYPGNLALGVAGDLELTRAVASAMGSELAGVGVDLDLAPDADVNSNPANPVIGVRSFGSDPARVAAQTVAWLEGMQGAGVAACVKHFPGHGDTSVDSHLALPVVGEDPRRGALEPFRAAIAAGVRGHERAHPRPFDGLRPRHGQPPDHDRPPSPRARFRWAGHDGWARDARNHRRVRHRRRHGARTGGGV